jgi:signal peptidase I
MYKKLLLTLIFCVFLTIFLRIFVIQGFTIPTPSMQPTLNIGDWVWIQKKAFLPVKRTDILAFQFPKDPKINFIKRCMGLPGDSLYVEKGEYLLVEGTKETAILYIPKKGQTVRFNVENFLFYKKLIEQYEHIQAGIIANSIYINGKITDSYTFTQNYYYMLGDNQAESNDSRNWGLVPESYIIGKLWAKWE